MKTGLGRCSHQIFDSIFGLPAFSTCASGRKSCWFHFHLFLSLNLKIESMIFHHFHLDRNMLWKVILLLRNNLPNVSHYFTLSVTTRVSVGNHCMFQLKYLDNTNEEEKGSLFVNENCTVILVYNGEIHVNDCLSSILKKNRKKKSASRRRRFFPSSLNLLLPSLL